MRFVGDHTLNDIVKQDHRAIEQTVRPTLGYISQPARARHGYRNNAHDLQASPCCPRGSSLVRRPPVPLAGISVASDAAVRSASSPGCDGSTGDSAVGGAARSVIRRAWLRTAGPDLQHCAGHAEQACVSWRPTALPRNLTFIDPVKQTEFSNEGRARASTDDCGAVFRKGMEPALVGFPDIRPRSTSP